MPWKPDYATVDELKDYLRIDDVVDDTELALALNAASRAIDRETNRQFGVTDVVEERIYDAEYSARRCVYVTEIDDLQTLTGLTVNVSGSPTTEFTLMARNAALVGEPWTRIHTTSATPPSASAGGGPTLEITATWGWTSVPDTIKQATLVQANRFIKRRESPFGVAGSPELGNELRLLAKMDPDVAVMVAAFRRNVPFL